MSIDATAPYINPKWGMRRSIAKAERHRDHAASAAHNRGFTSISGLEERVPEFTQKV